MFVCPFGPQSGRVSRPILFFLFSNLDTHDMQHHSCVCAFLGLQSLRIGLIMVLEGIVFHYVPLHFVKMPFWDIYYIF